MKTSLITDNTLLPGDTITISGSGASAVTSYVVADTAYSPSSDIQIDGDGDVYIGTDGDGVDSRLNRIEGMLGIVGRSKNLEKQYDWLKEIGDEYDLAIYEMVGVMSNAITDISNKYKYAVEECNTMEKLKSNND